MRFQWRKKWRYQKDLVSDCWLCSTWGRDVKENGIRVYRHRLPSLQFVLISTRTSPDVICFTSEKYSCICTSFIYLLVIHYPLKTWLSTIFLIWTPTNAEQLAYVFSPKRLASSRFGSRPTAIETILDSDPKWASPIVLHIILISAASMLNSQPLDHQMSACQYQRPVWQESTKDPLLFLLCLRISPVAVDT